MNTIHPLNEALNRQTAKIRWAELERFFAQGLLIEVDKSLDLIDVAEHFTKDRKTTIENWLTTHKINKLSDPRALELSKEDTLLWAVVIDPWVLIQTIQN